MITSVALNIFNALHITSLGEGSISSLMWFQRVADVEVEPDDPCGFGISGNIVKQPCSYFETRDGMR